MLKMNVKNLVVCMVVVGLVSSSVFAAEMVIGFEPTTYSTGTLQGQDYWSSGGADHQVQASVVLSGTQSVVSDYNGSNTYAIRPLSQDNLSFQDGYTISYLVMMEDHPGYGEFRVDNSSNQDYVTVRNDARHYGTTRAIFVNGTKLGSSGYFTKDETYLITLVLDFTNQQVDATAKEISGNNPGYTVSGNDIAFHFSTTANQAKSGRLLLRGGQDSEDGDALQVVDDITFAVPEPATIGLLTFGAISLRRRRRR